MHSSDSRKVIQNEVDTTRILNVTNNAEMLESVNRSEEGKISEIFTDVGEKSFVNGGSETHMMDAEGLNLDTIANDSLMNVTSIFTGVVDQSSLIEQCPLIMNKNESGMEDY